MRRRAPVSGLTSLFLVVRHISVSTSALPRRDELAVYPSLRTCLTFLVYFGIAHWIMTTSTRPCTAWTKKMYSPSRVIYVLILPQPTKRWNVLTARIRPFVWGRKKNEEKKNDGEQYCLCLRAILKHAGMVHEHKKRTLRLSDV